MKTFEEFVDGEWVYYQNNYHDPKFRFQAFKSKYTHNAFRLKQTDKPDLIADISEITPIKAIYENANSDIQSSIRLPVGYVDSDADFTGIYHVQD